MGKATEICKNCEKEFKEDFEFCPYCGQKAKDELTIGVLFYNTITNYFSFDARFFKSFFPLISKPGYLASRFIEGKRLLYLHPAQLYLFVSVVFFFLLTTLVVRDQVQEIDTALKKTLNKPIISDSTKIKAQQVLDSIKLDSILAPLKKQNPAIIDENEVKVFDSLIKSNTEKPITTEASFDFDVKKVDSLIAVGATDEDIYKAMGMSDDAGYFKRKYYEQGLKFYRQRNVGQVFQAAYDTIPVSLFILLPIFALILKLMYRKRGTYAHHLVFSFYFFSFLFTVFSIVLIVNVIWDVPDWIDWFIVLSTYFYLLIAIKHFYRQGWFLSFIKTGIASFIYLMIVIPIAIVIIFLVGFLFN
ncbi:DUF3667 domain-containing protein [Sabulilitoribacter arenilitoris]|uniref:DUF3667 domain-containing protein n=1 Tax=Wocania arenilitoris TaxID=2044858 RepID=A0AAE3EQ70_9FLAO|nr:DUF3667 domain-containing protein [Wocania arenilitoris]MCF7568607.1 DUF3667 domain-containing protein [Wocania arenilitoris]